MLLQACVCFSLGFVCLQSPKKVLFGITAHCISLCICPNSCNHFFKLLDFTPVVKQILGLNT